VAYTAHTAAEDDPPIDPTLIDALGNPRERMNVLQFEKRIVEFVKSRYSEVAGVHTALTLCDIQGRRT
jgi:hypothetical protein